MTPQEIWDYKRKWAAESHCQSHTHTDLRREVQDWCKAHCSQRAYELKRFTDVYVDTVCFELEKDFDAFNVWYSERFYEKACRG